jgi:ATP-binding cassette subfamily F protein 3
MILSVSNISKSYNEVPVLKNASFHIEENARAAIVGPNGAGKTTLIRIIMGIEEPDSGEVHISRDKTIGYLEQNVSTKYDTSIMQVLLSSRRDILDLEAEISGLEASTFGIPEDKLDDHVKLLSRKREEYEALDGYSYRSRVNGIFKGLGFADENADAPADKLSGGEKMRLKLGQTLLSSPDILILDEPTNHLDMNSLIWLEGYLKNYKGTVLLVSHDRYFLDRITDQIIEIDCTEVTSFSGNYSSYAVKKEILRTQRMNSYLAQQRYISHQEDVIKKLQSFNREKSIKRAESRKKLLSKIDVMDKPREYNSDMKIVLEPCIESGKDVLSIQNLSKSFDGRYLFENVDLEIKRGEHIVLIGDNGTGKTTLLKLINGLIPPDTGTITYGTKVHIAYYDQEHHVLNDDNTLFMEISDAYPKMTETEIRSTLAAFLFTGDEVFKEIKTLSGGEKGRLSLCKLMLSSANFLILDEPTNHLDIMSREILEDAINHYTGTILSVSHDRYFIDRTAERIIELHDQHFTSYEGDYTYYLYKSEELKASGVVGNGIAASTDTGAGVSGMPVFAGSSQSSSSVAAGTSSGAKAGALDYQAQKAIQAAKRKRENDLRKCEAEIERLENETSDLETQMNLPEIAVNSVKLQEIANKIADNTEKLSALYDEWEKLSE